MPRDDIDYQYTADDAAESEIVGRWAFDADAGHERGCALVLGPCHTLAGVNVDAVTDSGAIGADGGCGTVFDVLPAMDDGPRKGLTDGYGPP